MGKFCCLNKLIPYDDETKLCHLLDYGGVK